MRWLVPVCPERVAVVANAGSGLQEIEEFNQLMQRRFQMTNLAPPPGSYAGGTEHLLTSDPRALGMSRMAVPVSFGRPFLPSLNVTRDFEPENDAEKDALAELETTPIQVGLFGCVILDSTLDPRNYRALKGPAAVIEGAPRPRWYPTGENPAALPDSLPDWKAIYPLAQRAMKSFADGDSGFETSIADVENLRASGSGEPGSMHYLPKLECLWRRWESHDAPDAWGSDVRVSAKPSVTVATLLSMLIGVGVFW